MKTAKNTNGFSLIELLIVVAIFGVVMAGLYVAYSALLKEGVRQYRLAGSEMEHGIVKNILERDMFMAGYGLMDEYDIDGDGAQDFTPQAVSATEATGPGGADTLILMGTALGLNSRAAQGWTLAQDVAGSPLTPSFLKFNDAREDVKPGDRVIMTDAAMEKLLSDSTGWLFRYQDENSMVKHINDTNLYENDPFKGMIVYGISSSGTTTDITQPYYAVRYYLSTDSDPSSLCAPGTRSLLRAESRTDPSPIGGNPALNCVLDFQVALGLNTDEDKEGTIDLWDNGGETAAGYSSSDLNKRLKQVRAYALVQVGSRDRDYVYSNPDPAFAGTPHIVRVGDLYLPGGGTGRSYPLSEDQRKYRWRVITFTVSPRNLR